MSSRAARVDIDCSDAVHGFDLRGKRGRGEGQRRVGGGEGSIETVPKRWLER